MALHAFHVVGAVEVHLERVRLVVVDDRFFRNQDGVRLVLSTSSTSTTPGRTPSSLTATVTFTGWHAPDDW